MGSKIEKKHTTARRGPARGSGADPAAVLHLDADVYTQAALERARDAFAHLATIDIQGRGRSWLVRLAPIAPVAAERLADEFANHALSCLLVPS
jgi:hypothetical protein